MPTFARYTHLPLPSSNHIRLLEFPGYTDPSEPLQGTLRVVNLEESDIPYVALSYTWGKPNFSEDILLDGNTIFGITPTLAAALRRFRYASALRWIWVDAICINQQDNAEKTIQIPLMGDIYRGASRVTVWLGDRARDVHLLRQIKCFVSKIAEPYKEDDAVEKLGTRLSQLGRLPWFGRRWIIQELVLNSNGVLCCGPTELPWIQLAPAIQAIQDNKTTDFQNIRLLWDLWRDLFLPMDGFKRNQRTGVQVLRKRDIAALMTSCSAFECLDDRDLISGLIGLSTDGRRTVTVNYADTVEQTFINFAEGLARSGHMAWLIYQSLQRKKDPSDQGQTLPSWVPDWRGRISIRDQNSKLDTEIYKKVPCDIQMHSGSPSLHLLKTNFSVLTEEATVPGDSLQAPVKFNPAPLQVAWKSALFSKEADLAERITLTMESLWPWVVAHLSEDEMAFTQEVWFELLVMLFYFLVFPGQRGTSRQTMFSIYETSSDGRPVLPDFSQDASGLDTLRRSFIRNWLGKIFLECGSEREQEELVRTDCLILCRATSESGILTRGQPCAIGSLQLPFYHAVEIGDKVLSADLGTFHFDYRPTLSINGPRRPQHKTRHIVREHPVDDGVPLPLGIMNSDGLRAAGGASIEGLSRIPKARGLQETPLPLVYEFVAPCDLFGLFL